MIVGATPENPAPRSASSLADPPVFPELWAEWFDRRLPLWVKSRFSPRESWKGKPFTDEDVRFFTKGILELSELFTEERFRRAPDYLAHPRFRSAYLLYFLPLQAAKFVALFRAHPAPRALARKAALGARRPLELWDLGAGPGTASLAYLLVEIDEARREKRALPEFRLRWVDSSESILADGEALLAALSEGVPELGAGKVELRRETVAWDRPVGAGRTPPDLLLLGNVLNEGMGGPAPVEALRARLAPLLDSVGAGGTLFVEPAARGTAQLLSALRDGALTDSRAAGVWGPCLHAGGCPLLSGRDWCHFSFPAKFPGRWFNAFSRALGSERDWLKLSYLWLASPRGSAPAAVPAEWKRVLTDPMREQRARPKVLLCQPERPLVWEWSGPAPKATRGALVRVNSISVPGAKRAAIAPRAAPPPRSKKPAQRPRKK